MRGEWLGDKSGRNTELVYQGDYCVVNMSAVGLYVIDGGETTSRHPIDWDTRSYLTCTWLRHRDANSAYTFLTDASHHHTEQKRTQRTFNAVAITPYGSTDCWAPSEQRVSRRTDLSTSSWDIPWVTMKAWLAAVLQQKVFMGGFVSCAFQSWMHSIRRHINHITHKTMYNSSF
jgi:hypothetical protein